MITFKETILKHQKKKDGTWNVKIRVTYKGESKYLATSIFIGKESLNTKLTVIKNQSVKKKLERQIDEYRRIVDDIAITSSLNTERIIGFIKRVYEIKDREDVDFIAFSKDVIKEIRLKNSTSKNATSFQTVINSLQDFFKSERIPITDINARSLQEWENYLKTERKVLRNDKYGVPKEVTLKPMGNGIHNYLKDVRTLFNKAVAAYNDEDEDEVIIKHNPFRKYKVPKAAPTVKRNVKPDVIKKIRDYQPDSKRAVRSILARDVFMLSFYLVGINLIDLFQVDKIEKGRLTYNRSKTATRRDDQALISIKLEPEALDILKTYIDSDKKRVFNFYKNYSTVNNFTKAVNQGLSQLSSQLELEENITSYWARHSWATIARNICKISKDDVDLALNHVDPHHKLADIYIEKDFSMIDESNRKVLDTLR